MKTKKEIWNTIWEIIKFILTIGLSHINKRKENQNKENNTNNQN